MPQPRATTPRLRAVTGVLSLLLAATLLTACGGGSSSGDGGEVGGGEARAFANVVMKNDDPGVRLDGGFEAVDGYLSQSRKVLRSGAGGASARFSLAATRRGYYEVYAWWPQAAAGAGAAELVIRDAAGESTRRVDQAQLGGQWVALGVFELDPAKPASVTFKAVGAAPLLVDALRFQFVGDERPAVSVLTQDLPVALQNHAYEGMVEAQGGVAPYSFRVASGALPDGFELERETGAIRGIAALPGRHAFEVGVTDAQGREALQALAIEIVDTIDLEPTTTPPTARLGAPRAERRVGALAAGTAPLGGLAAAVAAMPEGEWRKVNLNLYSDVWAPASLRPLYFSGNPAPSKIISAWSSFAWDSNRGALILYGGGHANYRGNDVYLWRASTQMWERGALPSEMVQDALGNWRAVDGPDHAPASAHTYDNALFLPGLDRMLMIGGAADANGGHYLRQNTATTSRKTGAYLFNPALADPDKVGGSTGSHVKRVAPYPEVVGGNMWSNRDMYLNNTGATPPPSEAFVNGCTASAVEGGKDVAFVRTTSAVYKYTINDLANPAADTWQRVGVYFGGPGSKATCGYDPEREILVRTGSQSTPFVYWNLAAASPTNRDVNVRPVDPSGEFTTLLSSNAITISNCALDFDPVRRNHKLWCGDGRVWSLTAPATLSGTGWSIVKEPAPAALEVPTGSVGTGILGKWKYIENLDVFMGLQDAVQGNVWVYKPVGWQDPSGGGGGVPNVAPSVSFTAPAADATFEVGTPITLSATAADSDGSVARVEFFHGAAKLGEATSPPYAITWTTAPVGTLGMTVRATDNLGAQANAGPLTINVVDSTPPPPANMAPSVGLVAPAAGASFAAGVPIVLRAEAADSDGSIVRVEFFRGASKIGEAVAAPFEATWAGAPAGASTLTAVATDDDGAQTTSAPVTINVEGSGGAPVTLVLQRGLNGYAASAETYLSTYHKTSVLGASSNMQDQSANYSMLVRFAIFQSEGGPVPDGATIQSAKLSLYKYSAYDMVYGAYRMLRAWPETAATWNAVAPGTAWATAGANGAGIDHLAAVDASAAVGFSAGWLELDLTAAVQQIGSATPLVNHGWRVRGISGNVSNLKRFHSSEYTAKPALRPKLEITFQ